MHFEPSALYQSKWEEDELGATSSETRSHADKSDKALWSASNQTDCKYFETITSSEFISSTQVCFKRHSAKCLYVANVQSPLQSSNWSANILNLNWPFRIMPIFTYEQFCECNENLSQQVAIILRKLRRFSRLNFQWLQSKLNLAIVSLFLEDFCRIFRRNNNIRV